MIHKIPCAEDGLASFSSSRCMKPSDQHCLFTRATFAGAISMAMLSSRYLTPSLSMQRKASSKMIVFPDPGGSASMI
jgi:hypothetical protein